MNRQSIVNLVNSFPGLSPVVKGMALMLIHQTPDSVIESAAATVDQCLEVIKRDGSARELVAAAGIPFEALESLSGSDKDRI